MNWKTFWLLVRQDSSGVHYYINCIQCWDVDIKWKICKTTNNHIIYHQCPAWNRTSLSLEAAWNQGSWKTYVITDDPAAHIIMPTNSSDRSKLIEEHLIALKQKHAADEWKIMLFIDNASSILNNFLIVLQMTKLSPWRRTQHENGSYLMP